MKRAIVQGLPSEQAPVLAGLPPGARLLVIRLRSMGDTVLMTPALGLLHQWRPELRLSVLVESPWEELLEGNPAIHSVMVLRGKLRAAWRIRQEGFSLVVNLHGGPTSAWLTRWSGSPWRAAFAHYSQGSAYNLRVPTAQEVLGRAGPVHTAEHIASCLFWLGVPPEEIPAAKVFPSHEAMEAVRSRLRRWGLSGQQEYAVIHPAAVYASKQWKAAGFAAVSEHLSRRFDLVPVYLCGRGEADVLDAVERAASHPILRAEGWPLRELVALIARARVFVGNDSGPAHIAAAAGIPAIVIFGSSHSAVWRPWRAVESAVVQNAFDCNPCAGDRCHVYDAPRCILSISVEQVKVCAEALLAKSPASRSYGRPG